MADNVSIKNANAATVSAAADELSDGSFSPKVTLLAGDGEPTAISPATEGTLADVKTATEALAAAVSTEVQVDVVGALPAGTNLIGKTAEAYAVTETGITQIIDADDTEVSISGDYSSTADLSLGATHSGFIKGFVLTSDVGSGAVQGGDGVVFFFDADPNTTSGDTSISLAERKTIIGQVAIAAADWDKDAAGGSVTKAGLNIPFHAIATIYCVYRNTDGTAVWNSGAGDNEELHINMWWQRIS